MPTCESGRATDRGRSDRALGGRTPLTNHGRGEWRLVLVKPRREAHHARGARGARSSSLHFFLLLPHKTVRRIKTHRVISSAAAALPQIAEAGPNPDFDAAPLDGNLFEWHFTIRGPPGTAFEGGRYHGRITLPAEYPFKPPSIALLNASGRFTVGKKICLSVSAHHPEHWQPAWGIRTIITALIAFFPSKADGALAGLDYPDDERRVLAAASRKWCCPRCELEMETALPEDEPPE